MEDTRLLIPVESDDKEQIVSVVPRGIVRASTTKTIVLGPNGFLALSVSGDRFYIVDADSSVLIGIKTNRTIEEVFTAGCGKAYPPDQYFTGLELRNTSATATVTLLFWAGFGDYIDRRLTVVDGRFNSVVPVREAPTIYLARTSASIAGLTTVTFNTLPALTVRRKAIVVSNMDLANSLLILDTAGNPGTAVFPLTSVTLPISGEVKVRNGTASAIVCYIGEIFYSTT